MKKNWKNKLLIPNVALRVESRLFVIGLLIAMLVAGCASKEEKQAGKDDKYTCPMHPQIVRDQPGNCPICGMDLVRQARAGEGVKVTEDLGSLIKSPNEVIVSSIKTISGEYRSISPSIEAQGVVTYDTRKIYTIPARVGGRLEKVYLKYAFQSIRRGQKVAEIYSPELVTAQRELVYLIENDPGNSELIESAKNKFLLLGASDTQIKNLIERKEALNTFSVFSPYSGYLLYDNQTAPSMAPSTATGSSSATAGMGEGMSSGMGGGMNSSSNLSQSSPPIATGSQSLIREGDYVSTGQTLFKVVNTSALRIELDLPVSNAGPIKVGDEVELDFENGEPHDAKVDFVQPFFNETEEFVKLRVYTKDMENLIIGQLVRASIKLDAVESLWVPKRAVLDLGLERIVFVKDREVFKPRKVTTGIRADEWIEIKQGLSSSDEIASNAHYMVDSESFIKPSN